MTPTTTMRKALTSRKLLGHMLAGVSHQAMRTILIAAMGEALTDEERHQFKQLTGREREPLQRAEETVVIAGRRAGKSEAIGGVLVPYIAGLCKHPLARGEKGVLLCIAPDQSQAGIVLDYATAAFESSPILSQLIANRTADTLELTNGIEIQVRAASFRRLRGATYVAVVCDEAAFWLSENSANPDVEIVNAIRPGLATTGGPLVIISSPYARKGLLWETYKRHYGPEGDPLILVAQGSTRTFNTTLPQSVVDRALERDRAAASAEYLAEFRSDIEGFVTLEVVEACIGDHTEMMPISGLNYQGFCDPSGGSKDSFTMAVSHADGNRVMVDAVREIKPPFSPDAVIEEFATTLKTYRITSVAGDRYAGEFPRELFRKHGVTYACAEKPKSDLYRDLLPLLNSGRIVLPRSDRLVSQLVGLERRTARSGKDSIDHSPGGHDDLANAVAGAAALAIDTSSYDLTYRWVNGDDEDSQQESADFQHARLIQHLRNCGMPI